MKISESSSNGSYRNTDELDESTESAEVATSVLTCNDPHSYFSGFFITVNRSKQTMGDHLKTLASSFHVRFISNRKSFLPCQLQQERGLCLDNITHYHVRQAKYEYERSIATNMKEDNKIFWKFIQSKTKSKENITCIMDENG